MSNIVGQVADVRNTFSSWDQCMAKSYCKYPAIVGIVIGSLILLTVVYCLSKIICCGAKCCFCFADMARCCCCGSGGRGEKTEHHHHYSGLQPGQGGPGSSIYGPTKSGFVDPKAYNSSGGPEQGQYKSQPPPTYGVAQFDVSSKKSAVTGQAGEDSLPAMPSWNDAKSRRIEDPDAAVELRTLNDYTHGPGSGAHDQGIAGVPAVGNPGQPVSGPSRYNDSHYGQNPYTLSPGLGNDQHERRRLGESGVQVYNTQEQSTSGAAGYAGAIGVDRDGYGREDDSRYGQVRSGYTGHGHANFQNGYDRDREQQTADYGQQNSGYGRQDQGYGQTGVGFSDRRSPSFQPDHHGAAEYFQRNDDGGGYGAQRPPASYSSPNRGQGRSPLPHEQYQQHQHQQSYRSYSPVQSPSRGTPSPARQAYQGQQAYYHNSAPADTESSTLPTSLSAGIGPDAASTRLGGRKPVQGSWRDV